MIRITAPAKLNLYLHVTGRRHDGYHTLDSLAVFTPDIHDVITIAADDNFTFTATAERYADTNDRNNKGKDNNKDNGDGDDESGGVGHGGAPSLPLNFTDENNLVVRAARAMSSLCGRSLNCAITLQKNLPLAAGIGGGSANAAATVRGLLDFWGIDTPPRGLDAALLSLGADVPVCFYGRAAYMHGIGDIITPLDAPLPELFAVLINPRTPCPTPSVFAALTTPYTDNANDAMDDANDTPAAAPITPLSRVDLSAPQDLIFALMRRDNDLYTPARTVAPIITDVLHAAANTKNCMLARMSGSGATCFALFSTRDDARAACETLKDAHPDWWVHISVLS